ncbi:hypothetical protein LCGC14_1415390 [marine sediment metagenome]|uniref:Uncharacterized protein n=1 Tax=marine sediment metagenome TaxID=412755 RepID=A0A0F9JTC7_9ZZZZ
MIELSGFQLLVPVVVSAIVVAIRNVSAQLDGPAAYWWALGLNVLGQVVAELATGDGGVTAGAIGNAAALGIGTGATVSVGVATAGKRLGAGKVVKPKGAGSR